MKPKILLVSDFSYPITAGTERLVFGVADYFTNNFGIQTDILSPDWNNRGRFEEQNNVRIFRFKTHEISKSNPTKRIFDFVKRGIQLEKYDLYHGFYTMPPLLSSVILAKLRGSKSAITFFGREQLSAQFSNPVKKVLVLSVLSLSDAISAYNWNLKDYLLQYFPKKQMFVTTGFVDKKFSFSKKDVPLGKTILFVGRMVEEKGIFILLEAFSRLDRRFGARLVIIGPPYEKELVEKKIGELSIKDRVAILGFVSDKELIHWYNKATIVAVPSLFQDSFGLSLMEAIACKKPVVSTDSLGIPEIEGELVVEKNDPESLARSLEKLLTDEKFYKKAIETSKKMAGFFEKGAVMQVYFKIYKNLIKK